MKKVIFVILLVLLLCDIGIIYTISYRIDSFAWGSSKSDGLFMIVIPVWILPTTYLTLMIKWLLEGKWEIKPKNENYILFILYTLIGILVMFDSQFLYYVCIVLSLLILVWIINSMILRFSGK
ncbi:hypothetical protein [Cyclobacterium plantarum]|uniref:hypothetical protein n=1 Tax=Cyclobacterium plantarum TaxID=2716263 RepID=UPI003F6F6F38